MNHLPVSRNLKWCVAACLSAVVALLAGACSKTATQPSAPCSVTVGQVATAITAGGTTGAIPVTAGSGCAWTATSGSSFITITQGAAGTGNGTVQFTVAANTGAARTGTITVTGTTITFTQAAGVVAPSLAAPSGQSPTGGQQVDSLTPTLVVTNAAATGSVGTVTYRFEVSDVDSFPDSSRTQAQDGVAQGGSTTSWQVPRNLTPNTTYSWRARATNGTVTTAFSGVETFRTPNLCTFNLSTTSVPALSTGGTFVVTVATDNTCAWTATSNSAFITIGSGASGTGNGTVAFTVAASSGAARSGTLTVAGQTVTVNQVSGGVVASFRLFDFATQSAETTECRFRSVSSTPTTCTLDSNSFTLGPNVIVNYAWTVQYTYVTTKVLQQTGLNPRFTFTDVCGQVTSTDDGVSQPLQVQLTVTDSVGNTATASSGSGSQPALVVRLFSCGL